MDYKHNHYVIFLVQICIYHDMIFFSNKSLSQLIKNE